MLTFLCDFKFKRIRVVMHVASLSARLHDTGPRDDFRTGASPPRLMPYWIENFIPVRKVANKYQSNH